MHIFFYFAKDNQNNAEPLKKVFTVLIDKLIYIIGFKTIKQKKRMNDCAYFIYKSH